MRPIFITGTDTDVGKTLVASWLCLHSSYAYFKPIQTGSIISKDSNVVSNLSPNTIIHSECFIYKAPVSPHLAATMENEEINIQQIILPSDKHVIIEGAGGVLVPINKNILMIDLILQLHVEIIIVAHSKLGVINHTLLTIEALRARNIPILGVIMNGQNQSNVEAINNYGKVEILATMPKLPIISTHTLQAVPLTKRLTQILGDANLEQH